eukprot:7906412-Pyramimonas_sp.AAC.1
MSSAEGPSGTVHMRSRRSFKLTTHTLRGHIGAPTRATMAQFACVPAAHFGTPLTRCVAS